MITSDELEWMREYQEDALPDTATIQRVSRTPDNAGGASESWEKVATVACRVAPSGRAPEDRAVAERLNVTSSWTITVPAETDVRAGDRVVVDARTFEVLAVLAGSYETARRVVCSEVA